MKNSKIIFSISLISVFLMISMSKPNTESQNIEIQKPIKQDTIIIKEKSGKKDISGMFEYLTEDNLELLLNKKNVAFVHYGFTPYYNPEFEKKYGVKIHNEGCVISPNTNGLAKKNNQILANYLTGKFGENWKKDLGITPFGLK